MTLHLLPTLAVFLASGFQPGSAPAQASSETARNRELVEKRLALRLRDGIITDHFTSRDDLGMTQQLGLLPLPGGQGAGGRSSRPDNSPRTPPIATADH